ncbi:glutamate-rich protein 1 [Talpa occidentalis]|uniref:glutamate-rich protein 1 n=1 Tax=Talpa occidentalis TaxID=50954 RepID=UPI0023F9030C|nr:glutamate-rich protein 1 [Talpa occidentalis]
MEPSRESPPPAQGARLRGSQRAAPPSHEFRVRPPRAVCSRKGDPRGPAEPRAESPPAAPPALDAGSGPPGAHTGRRRPLSSPPAAPRPRGRGDDARSPREARGAGARQPLPGEACPPGPPPPHRAACGKDPIGRAAGGAGTAGLAGPGPLPEAAPSARHPEPACLGGAGGLRAGLAAHTRRPGRGSRGRETARGTPEAPGASPRTLTPPGARPRPRTPRGGRAQQPGGRPGSGSRPAHAPRLRAEATPTSPDGPICARGRVGSADGGRSCIRIGQRAAGGGPRGRTRKCRAAPGGCARAGLHGGGAAARPELPSLCVAQGPWRLECGVPPETPGSAAAELPPLSLLFVEKVLKRLFAGAPGAGEQGAPPAHQEAPESAEPGPEAEPGRAWGARPPGGGAPRPGVRAAGGPSQALARRRPYTVSLPPEGYLPAPLAPPCGPDAPSPSGSSSSSSSSSEEEDQDPHDQPKRRIRKHKSKKKFKNPNNVHVEQAELEKQQSLLQKELQPQHTDGPTISKNKKRKLKKKQQIKRKKAAGLLTKPSPGLDFTYQPEACGQEPAPQGEEAGEAGDLAGASPPAQSLLSFLKSTQETYFYDGVSDPAVSMETAEGLLRHLETHGLAPSDLRLLDHMQTLLLSGDAAGLRGALEAFPGRCELPPDHARVISALFSYWITHVLPEKQQ